MERELPQLGNTMINPEWYRDDVFLDTWVGDRTASTKDLYRKAWKRYMQFYDEVRGESPSPEFLIREFKRDIKQDRSTISDTIIRWHRWMVNDIVNPMTGGTGLSYGFAQTYIGAICGFYRRNTRHRVLFADPFGLLFPNIKVRENKKRLFRPDDVHLVMREAEMLRDKAYY
ncbi:MAG: hypothetical protein ACTSV2_08505 [Candidatus Thorarchaeota archaeon]